MSVGNSNAQKIFTTLTRVKSKGSVTSASVRLPNHSLIFVYSIVYPTTKRRVGSSRMMWRNDHSIFAIFCNRRQIRLMSSAKFSLTSLILSTVCFFFFSLQFSRDLSMRQKWQGTGGGHHAFTVIHVSLGKSQNRQTECVPFFPCRQFPAKYHVKQSARCSTTSPPSPTRPNYRHRCSRRTSPGRTRTAVPSSANLSKFVSPH